MTLVLGGAWMAHFGLHSLEHLREFETDSFRRERERLKWQVDRAIEFIEHERALVDSRARRKVRERVYQAHALASALYDQRSATTALDEVARDIRDSLRPLRFEGDKDYFFVGDMKGIMQLYPSHPHLEGTSFLDRTDPDGRPVVQDLIRIAREQGEGFYEYRWTRPDTDGNHHLKLSFVTRFEPLDWFIGTGVYRDDAEADAQNATVEWLSHLRFGSDGYLFAGTWEGDSLLGPLAGGNVMDLIDRNGLPVVRELVRLSRTGGGYLEYVMPPVNGQREAPKLSYVRGVPEWRWYVGAGVYLDEVETAITRDRAVMQRSVLVGLAFVGIVLLAGLFAASTLSQRFAARMRKEFNVFGDFFERAATENTPIDPARLQSMEFTRLAEAANRMVVRRQEAEAELRGSESRFRSVVESSPMGMFFYRLESPGRLVFMDANPSASRILGYDCSQLIGRTMEEAFPPLAETDLPREFRRVAAEGGFWMTEQVEYEHETIRGAYEVHVFRISPDNIVVAFLDITERRRAEEELRQSEARFRQLVDQAADPIFLAEPDGRLLDVNQQACENLGYTREELLRLNVTAIDAVLSDAGQLRAFHESLEPGKPLLVETVHRRKDGSLFPVELRVGSLRIGDHVRLLGIARDISNRRQAERDRAHLEDQLRQAQKMEAVGQLAGGMAHDFNNLLQAIIGYSNLALLDLEDAHPARRELDEVLKASQRASDLIRQMLAFSRRQVMQVADLDLNAVVAGMSKLLGRVIGEHIRFEFRPAAAIANVRGDRNQIEQVLVNLCVNARDAMPDGGTLLIETENVTLDAQFAEAHSWAVPGRYVRISVADDGEGMDAATLEHVFEPFFTTKAPGQGTGLGLSMVYGIVRQHDGMIHAYSEPGEGSRFSIYLPVAEPQGEAEPAAPDPVARGGDETILLAEDNAQVRALACEVLERQGYTVLTAVDGDEAIRVFEEHIGRIDLALLDVIMPGKGGHEVFARIAELRPHLPVLFASGYTQNTVRNSLVRNRGVALLQKPYNPSELLLRVRDLLDQAGGRAQ